MINGGNRALPPASALVDNVIALTIAPLIRPSSSAWPRWLRENLNC